MVDQTNTLTPGSGNGTGHVNRVEAMAADSTKPVGSPAPVVKTTSPEEQRIQVVQERLKAHPHVTAETRLGEAQRAFTMAAGASEKIAVQIMAVGRKALAMAEAFSLSKVLAAILLNLVAALKRFPEGSLDPLIFGPLVEEFRVTFQEHPTDQLSFENAGDFASRYEELVASGQALQAQIASAIAAVAPKPKPVVASASSNGSGAAAKPPASRFSVGTKLEDEFKKAGINGDAKVVTRSEAEALGRISHLGGLLKEHPEYAGRFAVANGENVRREGGPAFKLVNRNPGKVFTVSDMLAQGKSAAKADPTAVYQTAYDLVGSIMFEVRREANRRDQADLKPEPSGLTSSGSGIGATPVQGGIPSPELPDDFNRPGKTERVRLKASAANKATDISGDLDKLKSAGKDVASFEATLSGLRSKITERDTDLDALVGALDKLKVDVNSAFGNDLAEIREAEASKKKVKKPDQEAGKASDKKKVKKAKG